MDDTRHIRQAAVLVSLVKCLGMYVLYVQYTGIGAAIARALARNGACREPIKIVNLNLFKRPSKICRVRLLNQLLAMFALPNNLSIFNALSRPFATDHLDYLFSRPVLRFI